MARRTRLRIGRGALALVLALAGHAASARAGEVALEDAFPDHTFERPVFLAQAPGADAAFYVADQGGTIFRLEGEYRHVFLDLTDRVQASSVYRTGNEEGLLGMAFHPGFAENGRFFVHYTRRYTAPGDRQGIVSEFRVTQGGVQREDERVVLAVPQPYSNHNGGMLAFGPDGMLYVALGDGGAAGDPQNHGQNLGTLLGAILRIDVDAKRKGYGIPKDNPFRRRGKARGEIWAYGLRNPWRFSFDRATGELWAGDVGQERWEEICLIERGGNYGWARQEGADTFRRTRAKLKDPLLPPLAAYGRRLGTSVIGGYVYRGSDVPWLRGAYLYTDFMTGNLWALRRKPDLGRPPRSPEDVEVELLQRTGETVASFGEDKRGELYLCSFRGRVLRIEDADGLLWPELPAELSELGVFADLPKLEPVAGAHRYAVHAAPWADHAVQDRFVVLPEGGSLAFSADGAFGSPVGTRIVQTFTLPDGEGGSRRLETRVIERTDDGWDGAAYRWRPDLTEADRIDDGASELVDGPQGRQLWEFPSPAQCRSCHSPASGYYLGLHARQIRSVEASETSLLTAWTRSNVLTGAPETAPETNVAPTDTEADLGARARSYLDANCAACHRPAAPCPAGLDLRSQTPLGEMGLIGREPTYGDLGRPGTQLVAPGKPARSLLLDRLRLTGAGRMPPLGAHLTDEAGIALLTKWIRTVRPVRRK